MRRTVAGLNGVTIGVGWPTVGIRGIRLGVLDFGEGGGGGSVGMAGRYGL